MIMKILPAVTTITPKAWKDKIKEVKELKLKEVYLFPTCLKQKERKELYETIEKTSIERIPFVHLRSDMELWELDYLTENYKTKVFNTHSQKEYPLANNLDKYKDFIYIENTYAPLDEEEIKEFAGICLDFSHLENDRVFHPEKYRHNVSLIEKCSAGCNHISAVKPSKEASVLEYDNHYLKDLSELDYLKKYPLKYFSQYIAIELENTIEQQLEAIAYIKKNILT